MAHIPATLDDHTLTATLFDDDLFGSHRLFDRVLHGGSGDDMLEGGAGRDWLVGGAGNDTVSGGAGGDLVNGGSGNDLLSGDAPASLWQDRPFITFSSPEPGLPIPVAAPLAGDVGGNDLLAGGAGNDILIGDAGSIHGSARGGDDILLGGAGDDRLFGDAYTDFATVPSGLGGFMFPDAGIGDLASGGNDYLDGGAGNDTLYGDALVISDFFRGRPAQARGGDDTLVGRGGDDVLVGDADRLSPLSSGGNDRLFGGAGNDALYGDTRFGDNGRGGNDELFGGAGDDFLAGGSGNNRIDGGSGVDTASFVGSLAAFLIAQSSAGFAVTKIASGDTDLVTNVEFLQFDDVVLSTSPDHPS